MSTPPPLPCMFDGEAFRVLPNFLRVAREHYGAGEVVRLIPHEERSAASHRHFFAVVNECWANLPDELAQRHRTPDSLRKFALVQTGYRETTTYVCKFKTEARRLAVILGAHAPDSVIVIDGKIVTKLDAESQSMMAMGKERFQASKDAVIAYLADLIGVDVAQVSRAAAAGGSGSNAGPRREAA